MKPLPSFHIPDFRQSYQSFPIFEDAVQKMHQARLARVDAQVLKGCEKCGCDLVENGEPLPGATHVYESIDWTGGKFYCGDCASGGVVVLEKGWHE